MNKNPEIMPLNNKDKILCVQISTHLINGKPDMKDISTQYYIDLYNKKQKDGYFKESDFWEIPLWITELDYNTPVDFYICKNIEDTVKYLLEHKYKYVCFSVLDVNKEIINNIMTKYNGYVVANYADSITFIFGGYIDFNYFHGLTHKIFKTIKDFITFLGIEYKQGNSYRLFKGYSVIPRLTLSTGCLNNCDFCTVERKIKETPKDVIEQQINAFKPLKFELVYINDKTFGQCANYPILPMLYHKIKKYNKNFKGFIIQTTTTQFNKISDKFLFYSHIKYVELGIESFNDDILKKYHKPSSERTILDSAWKIIDFNMCTGSIYHIKLIPNIIIGMPEETKETYQRTIRFLERHNNIISHYNIYNLAVYDNTPLASRINASDQDKNELNVTKTFHKDKNVHIWFYNKIHSMGIDQLKGV